MSYGTSNSVGNSNFIEDEDLMNELRIHSKNICMNNASTVSSIRALGEIIRGTSTAIQSIPRPLKFLAPYYPQLKKAHAKMNFGANKKDLADILSVVAICRKEEADAEANLECLNYCLIGTVRNLSQWGCEYMNVIHSQVITQMHKTRTPDEHLEKVIIHCLEYDFQNKSEIQACDLLMEINRLDMLSKYMNLCTYQRVCLYLTSCARYVDDAEQKKIYSFVADQYYHYREWIRGFILAMYTRNEEMLVKIFTECYNPLMLKQLAFLAGRQMKFVKLTSNITNREELVNIMSNAHLSELFLSMCKKVCSVYPNLIILFRAINLYMKMLKSQKMW